jgi:membrane-bound lytic murein transglycosylase D
MVGCANFPAQTDVSHTVVLSDPEKIQTDARSANGSVGPLEIGANDIACLTPISFDEASEDCKVLEFDDGAVAIIQAKLDEALYFYQSSQDFWQQGELENALHALDQAYSLILETDSLDLPKLTQQKDDLRFMISKRILEIYASRHTTAKGNHNAIPMVINGDVQKEIDFFTTGGGRNFFINSYVRSGRYRSFVLEEIKKAGIPEELSWLPLIESGFIVRALSPARALGLWQFIPSTGYKFGLKRNLHVDERLDPYKSTLAAIDYLKELHDIFGDWMTVLAAYNCGEGRVLRTIRDQNINYLDDFWDLYRKLPNETARYVPKFLATIHIINNMEQYGMTDITVDPPIMFETIMVSKPVHLKSIAEVIGVSEQILADLNPELRYKRLPNEEYALKIPPGTESLVLAGMDTIAEERVQAVVGVTHHRVRPGETLSTIARRYQTSVESLADANNIQRTNFIVVGSVLKVPQTGQAAASEGGKPKISTYEVRTGDSLWNLAKRFNTTTKRIQEMNSLKSARLNIGQVLKIPTGPLHGFEVYSVKQGDTPFLIARRFNMSLDEFFRINNLSKKSVIYPGQRVFVQ